MRSLRKGQSGGPCGGAKVGGAKRGLCTVAGVAVWDEDGGVPHQGGAARYGGGLS